MERNFLACTLEKILGGHLLRLICSLNLLSCGSCATLSLILC